MTKSGDLFKDGLSRCGPDEGPRLGIVVGDEAVDLAHEVGHRDEGAAADPTLGGEGEEEFDLIEPGGVGRGETELSARGVVRARRGPWDACGWLISCQPSDGCRVRREHWPRYGAGRTRIPDGEGGACIAPEQSRQVA